MSSTPRDAIANLHALEVEGQFTGPPGDARMAHLALMQAIQGVIVSLERVADRQDRHDEKLGEAVETVHAIDKRLAVVESNSVSARLEKTEALLNNYIEKIEIASTVHFEKVELRVDNLEDIHHTRINALEADKDQRAGSRGTMEKVFASPTIAWIFASLMGVAYYVSQHAEAVTKVVTNVK